jgi:transposase
MAPADRAILARLVCSGKTEQRIALRARIILGAATILRRAQDEESQIQALDRTKPSLLMKKGRAGTMTHWALHAKPSSSGVSQVSQSHRPQHPNYLDIHGIADNYAAHKKQEVRDGLAKHPRFHLHFIPASSSWLNLVERWFGKITTERIRRGVFTRVPELERAIYDYIERNNADPKPFVWTKSANAIILKVNRGRAALKMPPLARQDPIVVLCNTLH